jgi:tripartite-type tricarboxylate transporter receptor subunit TctC
MLSGDDSFAMCGVHGWPSSTWSEFVMMPKFTEKSRKAYAEKLTEYLRSSEAQDYYKTRSEKLAEFIKQAADENMFTAM